MFHLTFVLIAYFDWLLGPIDGKFSTKKNTKKSSLQKLFGGINDVQGFTMYTSSV